MPSLDDLKKRIKSIKSTGKLEENTEKSLIQIIEQYKKTKK